jgi:hypothetical protein
MLPLHRVAKLFIAALLAGLSIGIGLGLWLGLKQKNEISTPQLPFRKYHREAIIVPELKLCNVKMQVLLLPTRGGAALLTEGLEDLILRRRSCAPSRWMKPPHLPFPTASSPSAAACP